MISEIHGFTVNRPPTGIVEAQNIDIHLRYCRSLSLTNVYLLSMRTYRPFSISELETPWTDGISMICGDLNAFNSIWDNTANQTLRGNIIFTCPKKQNLTAVYDGNPTRFPWSQTIPCTTDVSKADAVLAVQLGWSTIYELQTDYLQILIGWHAEIWW